MLETVNQRQEIFNMMFSKQIGEEAQQDDVKKKKRGDYKKDEQMYKRARYALLAITLIGRSLIIGGSMIWPRGRQRKSSFLWKSSRN